jgi:hypothetical protein
MTRGRSSPPTSDAPRPFTKTEPGKPTSREATRDPKLADPDKTPGSGMVPDGKGDAPTG